MNKKKINESNIRIHWWNLGKKTLEYDGPIKGYLKKKNIKIIKNNGGYKATLAVSSCSCVLKMNDPVYANCASEAIKVFLMLLGDKSLYVSPCGRHYKINWR